MHKLNECFSKLQAEVSVTKQVNIFLSSRLVSIERHCWLNAQYSRWECLDIVGIPNEVEADALDEKVVNIFEKLECNISTEHIEACHRTSKKNTTVVVKFSQRKDCQQVLDVKKDLLKIEVEGTDLPGQNKLLINKSLCPYCKVIWAKCKKFPSLGNILGDTIKTRASENGFSLSLTHIEDFMKYFPDIDLSPRKCVLIN